MEPRLNNNLWVFIDIGGGGVYDYSGENNGKG